MSTTTKTKQVRKHRVKIDGHYAKLDHVIHTNGVLVRANSIDDAVVFDKIQSANAAVQRTLAVQQDIRDSMYSDWEKFKPVNYNTIPQLEEFWVDEDAP